MLNCEHMRPLYDLDVSYYPPWISWHNLNRKKRVLQFQHWLAPPNNWFRFKYTTKLDSAWEKYTYRLFFQGGGDLGKTLQWLQSLAGYQAVLAILGQNQTITQKAARFWSVEHYSIWQGMTQAPSVLRKWHIHGKTKIEQELFFKRQLREKWTR